MPGGPGRREPGNGCRMTEMSCRLCGELPASMTAYLDRDEELPAATRSLVWVGRSFRRCPECGAWFFRDYWPPGAGNVGDFETLQRLAGTLLDAVAALLAEGGPEGAGDATARVLAAGASEQDGDILEEAWIWRLSQPGGGIPGFAGLLLELHQ